MPTLVQSAVDQRRYAVVSQFGSRVFSRPQEGASGFEFPGNQVVMVSDFNMPGLGPTPITHEGRLAADFATPVAWSARIAQLIVQRVSAAHPVGGIPRRWSAILCPHEERPASLPSSGACRRLTARVSCFTTNRLAGLSTLAKVGGHYLRRPDGAGNVAGR